MTNEKLKICPNGYHSNGNPDCHCGEKVANETIQKAVEDYDNSFMLVVDSECEHGFNPYTDCPNRICEVRLRWQIRKWLPETLTQLLTHHDKEKAGEVVRRLEGAKYHLDVDEYLPLVEAWNKTNFDVPFDHGYEQGKRDALSIVKEVYQIND